MVSVATSTIGRLQMYPSLTPAIAKTMMWKGAVEHRRPKASWWNSNEAKLDMQTDPSNWPWCPCFLHPWIGSEWQKPVKGSHIEDWHTKYAAWPTSLQRQLKHMLKYRQRYMDMDIDVHDIYDKDCYMIFIFCLHTWSLNDIQYIEYCFHWPAKSPDPAHEPECKKSQAEFVKDCLA